MEAEKYSEYFNKCPVFTVPGRTYPGTNGLFLRRIDSCSIQLEVQGPSRTCNESKEEEEEMNPNPRPKPLGVGLIRTGVV